MTGFSHLGDVVRANAERFGDRIALASAAGPVAEGISFARLADRVTRLIGAFQRYGLEPGDRIAILARNRPDYLEAVLAAAAGGYIAVPLNWRLSPRELGAILEDCRPAMMIHDATSRILAADLRGAAPFVRRWIRFDAGYMEMMIDCDTHSITINPDSTACLVYTSGTTGAPKGAELSHRRLLLNAEAAIGPLLHLTPEDVTLAAMPSFHVGGLWYHLFPSFMAGCTTLTAAEFEPGAVLATVARERVTNFHLVPTMLHALVEHPDIATTDLASLRLVFYAASSMPLGLLQRSMAALPASGFVQGYGSTEAGMVSMLSEEDHRAGAADPALGHRLLSCGRPFEGLTVTLLGEASEQGEIAVESPQTMKRYWGQEPAESPLPTGDLGRIDADGYIYILDRKSDMIVTGGENVYPREVEEALLSHPAIAEAAVFDLPDSKWVQRVVAAVVPRAGMAPDPEEVVAHLRARLAGYKCPKEIFLVDQLPRNGAGKVLRKHLRAAFDPNKKN